MRDEGVWERAILTVSRNEHLPEDKFKDEEWSKVEALYIILKEKENGNDVRCD